jgi:hypothetical protein
MHQLFLLVLVLELEEELLFVQGLGIAKMMGLQRGLAVR